MEALFLQKFVLPTFMLYSGGTDPIEHVWDFHQTMSLLAKNDALLCQDFPYNLGKKAMLWYWLLKRNIVTSFDLLSTEFEKNCTLQAEEPKRTNYLFEVIANS